MIYVKIIDNTGYIIKGVIGIGGGAWKRAATIRNEFKLTDMPVSLQAEEWHALTADRIEEWKYEAWKYISK
tara:strand:+ start:5028 stop:5240 length:213 start_codon:yes stop_codon:yes gene_type:complete